MREKEIKTQNAIMPNPTQHERPKKNFLSIFHESRNWAACPTGLSKQEKEEKGERGQSVGEREREKVERDIKGSIF